LKGPLTFYLIILCFLGPYDVSMFFEIKNTHNLEIKGIFPSLILASDLKAV